MAGLQSAITVDTSPTVVTQMAMVDGKPHVFLANFTGLVAGQNPIPRPLTDVRIAFRTDRLKKVFILPFMGEERELEAEFRDGLLVTVIPEITRGAVVWAE